MMGGTESSVVAVSNELGTQRWMTDVSAKMIHGMTEKMEVAVTARICWRLRQQESQRSRQKLGERGQPASG